MQYYLRGSATRTYISDQFSVVVAVLHCCLIHACGILECFVAKNKTNERISSTTTTVAYVKEDDDDDDDDDDYYHHHYRCNDHTLMIIKKLRMGSLKK